MKFKDLDKSVQVAFYSIGVTFILLILATIWTIKLAYAGHEAVMDPDYHQIGLNYEKTLASTKEMLEEGYELRSELLSEKNSLKSGDNPIQVQFLKNLKPIQGAEVRVRRERGATTKFTKDFELIETSPGNYTHDSFQIPDTGQWVVTIYAKENDRILRKVANISVQN